jgi:hypothetical protein
LRTNVISKPFALFVLLLISTGSHAKDFRVADVFAGYSLLHGDLQKHSSGWEVSGGYYFQQWLSLHADFDAHYQSSAGSQRHQHNFLFGPEFSHRTSQFTLFAHVLAGGSHTDGSLGTATGFASALGGGIDWDHDPFLSLRLGQVDFLSTHLFGAFQHQARFSFGVVFRLAGFRDPPRRIPPPPERKDLCKK